MEIATVIAFLLYIGYREWMHYVQVKDLEIKLLSNNPTEYQAYKRKPEPNNLTPNVELPVMQELDDLTPEEAIEALKTIPK